MSEISSDMNINAHYSTQAKVKRPVYTVAQAPNALPNYHLYNDIDANNRLSQINNDIYKDAKTEKGKGGVKFWKGFAIFVAAVLAFLGIKKIL